MRNVIYLKPAVLDEPCAPAADPCLVFSNPGTLDLNLVKLLGVSVKESDDPIGFFGTGLKSAMATALRMNGEMSIITNGQRYDVRGRQMNLRYKSYRFNERVQVARCDGRMFPNPGASSGGGRILCRARIAGAITVTEFALYC